MALAFSMLLGALANSSDQPYSPAAQARVTWRFPSPAARAGKVGRPRSEGGEQCELTVRRRLHLLRPRGRRAGWLEIEVHESLGPLGFSLEQAHVDQLEGQVQVRLVKLPLG